MARGEGNVKKQGEQTLVAEEWRIYFHVRGWGLHVVHNHSNVCLSGQQASESWEPLI